MHINIRNVYSWFSNSTSSSLCHFSWCGRHSLMLQKYWFFQYWENIVISFLLMYFINSMCHWVFGIVLYKWIFKMYFRYLKFWDQKTSWGIKGSVFVCIESCLHTHSHNRNDFSPGQLRWEESCAKEVGYVS
jgi:hypothetical protein